MNYKFSVLVEGQLSAASIQKIQAQLQQIGKNAGVKIDSTPIKQASGALKEASKSAGIFGQSITDVAKKVIGWTAITTVVFGVIRAIRNGIQAVVDLDTALVELRKVTRLSESALGDFTKQAMEVGTTVARTTQEIVSASAMFARMGFSPADSLNLAQQAAVLVNVGDGINDVGEAAGTIISVLKGFGMEASQAMSAIDKLNEVSNNYAVTVGDLSEGLTRVSASLAAAGNTLDQSIAMITSASEVIRDSGRASIAQYVTRYVQKCA